MHPVPASLYYGGSAHVFDAEIRNKGRAGIAWIRRGWGKFVKHYDLQEDDVIVMSLRQYGGRVHVRIFRLA